MPQRSNDFQKLVFLINKSLHRTGDVIESALLKDKITGEEREVDILLSSSVATYPINIAIEVIDRARKADTTWVEQMHSKHLTLPTDKLILVSRNGFYEPALRKAKFYGIDTITINEALDTDWNLGMKLLRRGFFEMTTYHFKCSALCSHPDGELFLSGTPTKTTVYLPQEGISTNFEEMFLTFMKEPAVQDVLHKRAEQTGEKDFALRYEPSSGTYVEDENNVCMNLLRLDIEFEIIQKTTPVKFAVGRYQNKAFSLASSSDPNNKLCFALLRNNDDSQKVEGILYDETGIKEMTVNLLA